MRKIFYIIIAFITVLCSGCGDNKGNILSPYMMKAYIPQGNGKGDLLGKIRCSHLLGYFTNEEWTVEKERRKVQGAPKRQFIQYSSDTKENLDETLSNETNLPEILNDTGNSTPKTIQSFYPYGYAEIDNKFAFFMPSELDKVSNAEKDADGNLIPLGENDYPVLFNYFKMANLSIGEHKIDINAYGYPKFSTNIIIKEDEEKAYEFYISKYNEFLTKTDIQKDIDSGFEVKELNNMKVPEPNYYRHIVEIHEDDSNNIMLDIRRFTKSPILLYIDKKNVPSNWTNDMATQVVNAFGVWEEACQELQFELIDERERADISVVWTSRFTGTGVLGLTSDPDPKFPDYPGYKVLVELSTEEDNVLLSENLRFSVAIHEIGHALGLWGHSPNLTDIMYYAAFRPPYEKMPIIELSQADVNTINILYKIIPSKTNISTSSGLSRFQNILKLNSRTMQ